MPHELFSCPKCSSQFTAAPDVDAVEIACPDCGWWFPPLSKGYIAEDSSSSSSLATEEVEVISAAVDGAADAASSILPEASPEYENKAARKHPRWAWGILALVVILGIVALGVGVVAMQSNQPDPSTARSEGKSSSKKASSKKERPKQKPQFALYESPAKGIDRLAPVSDDLSDMGYLLPDDQQDFLEPVRDHLEFELARQALWLAAHEEFGLRFRDSSLGEDAPKNLSGDRQFRIRKNPRELSQWSVKVGIDPHEHKLWEGRDMVGVPYLESPDLCISGFETLSREFFSKCLVASGFTPRPNKKSDASVPREAEREMGKMREISQFAAIRLLHAEMRSKGESKALLGALARAYANLGLLTQYQWDFSPFVCKARALLYAQRLVAQSPGDRQALYVRAYAAALSGMHALALKDLADAAKLSGSIPPPSWVEAIDAYVHFDLDRLDGTRKKDDTSLVRLLKYLAIESPETPGFSIQAGKEFLEYEPECYLVHDSQCRVGGVSHLHGATLAGLPVFEEALRWRVRDIPGLPASVAGVLNGDKIEPEIYASLRGAGNEPTDRGEPSWAALGNTLQNVRFNLVYHRLRFLDQMLSVGTSGDAKAVLPTLRGHPFYPVIESYAFDSRSQGTEVRERLRLRAMASVDWKASGYHYRLSTVNPVAASAWGRNAIQCHGTLYPEVARQMNVRRENDRARTGGPTLILQRCSPYSPRTQAYCTIAHQSLQLQQLLEIEKEYSRHPVVMWGLGERHFNDNRMESAIRCWKKWIALSPSAEGYRRLASAYLGTKDETRWRQTLEESLKQEDTGLIHAQVNVELAEHFMDKHDFKTAEPYADAAAESYAAFGLLCAGRCQAGLGNWGKANEWYSRAASRYPECVFTWYLACRATGKMDRDGAEKAVREYLARYGPGTSSWTQFQAAQYLMMKRKPGEARALVDRSNVMKPSDDSLLFAAFLADAAGDEKARDSAISRHPPIFEGEQHTWPIQTKLGEWFKSSETPSSETVDIAIKELPTALRADGAFYYGWFLKNRGQAARATQLWKRCLETPGGTWWLKAHARVRVEERWE